MFHCFTFFLVIRFCILRLSLNAPALHQLFLWSIPAGRGKVALCIVDVHAIGITPAWAGKSKLALCTPSCPTDHPRACGEKNKELEGVWLPMGSPPHGRGKVMKANKKVKENGITPAWAGKRTRCQTSGPLHQDHPRVGGEKSIDYLGAEPCQGSPPRGRGKARHLSHGLLPCG